MYTVSQLTLSMEASSFSQGGKKEIDRHETENLKDIELKLKGMDRSASAVDEKLKNIRRLELAKGLILGDSQLVVWC